MPKIKFLNKIHITPQKIQGIFISHIGEIFLLVFVVIFGLGFFVFWYFAWRASDFKPQTPSITRKIPKKSLDDSLLYMQGKENLFKASLPSLNIRDPFNETREP